ncbi:MAG: XdhC family protein [Pseudomonadota bacterium]
MQASDLSALNKARRDRTAILIATDLGSGEARIIHDDGSAAGGPVWPGLGPSIADCFRTGRSALVRDADGREIFLGVQVPAPRLVVVGAVHISQAMVPIAAVTGFDLVVVDPRTAFASADRFPGVALEPVWPEDVLPGLNLDRYTAFAALTHDPKIDDWAIAHALERHCFYVGALGSRKTHGKRRDRLIERGVSAADLDRIDAPIGADIGAASPAEIAVAIIANVIAALRRRSLPAGNRDGEAAA